MKQAYFIGIDVGTQGARVVLLDSSGNVAGIHETAFDLTVDSRQEQDPEVWWASVLEGLNALVRDAKGLGIHLDQLHAISVTSTSGTVIPLDQDHLPLHPAIMYSDPRSQKEGVLCREMATLYHPGGYHGFNASSGLSKMVWYVNAFPEKVQQLAHWAHAADYILGKLSGSWDVTDETNVLKSGYDLVAGNWPAYLTEHLPLKSSWLPKVVSSGQPIGHLKGAVGKAIGIPELLAPKIIVTAGMTDGCASQVAAGAVRPGNWNTTIGTTLVIKGVTKAPIIDAQDRLYNHRHPEGYWMPGGASNTGADWVSARFGDELEILEKAAADIIPTAATIYPLMQKGERFPFIAASARGFGWDEKDTAVAYAAAMEGVAYIEKMAFHLIQRLSGEYIDRIYTAGGASNSPTWLKIRSSVLQLPICKMEQVSGAVGAAVLAASRTYYHALSEAVAHMTRIEQTYDPDETLTGPYQLGYQKFVKALAEKKYIKSSDYLS